MHFLNIKEMQHSISPYFVLSPMFISIFISFFPQPIFLVFFFLGALLQSDTRFIYKYNAPANNEILSQASRMFVDA